MKITEEQKQESEQIFTKIEPEQENRNNINQVVSYEQHLHSTVYRLLHTAVGGIGDQRVLYYENQLTYVTSEDGIMLAVE